MAELSQEQREIAERILKEIQQEIRISVDGYMMCQILVSMANGATLIDYGPDERWCGWFRKEGTPIGWPKRRTVKVLEHIGYISPRPENLQSGKPVFLYELTDKALKFLAQRENRIPHADEEFWTIIYKKPNGEAEVFIHVGPARPEPMDFPTDATQYKGDIEVHKARNWYYIYAKTFGLSQDQVRDLEKQPIWPER